MRRSRMKRRKYITNKNRKEKSRENMHTEFKACQGKETSDLTVDFHGIGNYRKEKRTLRAAGKNVSIKLSYYESGGYYGIRRRISKETRLR